MTETRCLTSRSGVAGAQSSTGFEQTPPWADTSTPRQAHCTHGARWSQVLATGDRLHLLACCPGGATANLPDLVAFLRFKGSKSLTRSQTTFPRPPGTRRAQEATGLHRL